MKFIGGSRKDMRKMRDRICLSSPHLSDEGYEMEYINEAFKTNWIAPLGANVDGFERELAKKVGANYSVALNSGTAAIHMALMAAGIGEGDIVLCQSLTFAATVNPILYQKAIPVFIGSNEETWNMSPISLEIAFEKYPEAKAVIVVHLYGIAANLDEIVRICKEHGAVLIEDAAESLGTTYKGRYTGTIGDYGIFSFNGNKILTTSGGGMLVGKDKERIEKVRFWATQAREKVRFYEHTEIGYNYRMSNVVAGIGRGQLKVLEERINRKKEIYQFYKEAFKGIDDIKMMPINPWNNPSCWLSAITLKGSVKPIDLILALEEENIEARHVWKPMHLQPVFKEYDYIGDEVAETLFRTGVCLPSDTKMTEEDLTCIVGIVKGLWQYRKKIS